MRRSPFALWRAGLLALITVSLACSDTAGPGAALVVTLTTSASQITPGESLHVH